MFDYAKHPEVSPELFQRNLDLEKEMITQGVEALHRAVNKAKERKQENNTVYGNRLVSHSLPQLTEAIEAAVAVSKTGKAGRLVSHVKFLSLLPADVTAALSLIIVMQQISARVHLNPVALSIGDALEDELRRRAFKEQAPKRFTWVEKRAEKSSHLRHKKRLFQGTAQQEGVESPTFSRTDKLHAGIKLVELIVQSTGLVSLDKVSEVRNRMGKKTGRDMGWSYMITPTRACMEWIAERINHCEALSPKYLPTLVPPKPWESPFNGGYYTEGVHGRVLIKTRYKGYLEELEERVEDMPELYEAVNAIQNTSWKINQPILETIRTLWDLMPEGVAGLPPREPLPLPPCPVCGAILGDTSPLSARENHTCFETCPPDLHKQWRIAAAHTYDKQTSLTSKRLSAAKTLYLAEKFATEDAFYFPHQLDFRGRAYPMPSYLTPQGTDLAKGLLTFAKGKPLGKTGGRWLAIHLANCWGEDKVSLDDRAAWTEAHQEHILASAANPLDFLWWVDADKPAQFLAACIEWTGWVEEGEAFVSHLPIAMDGTCNGLQIFSLMLRDEVGGRAVNLLPSDKPQDIYGIVAEKVVAALEHLKEYGGVRTKTVEDEDGKAVEKILYDEKDMAERLLKLGINRKMTKRQVMVVPYGGTIRACQEYTLEALEDKIAAHPELAPLFPEGKDAWAAMLMLSPLIWQAIDTTVQAAQEAMGFLQKLASIACKKDLPITWTTPLGFPVLQAYKAVDAKRVKTHLFGELYWPKIAFDTPDLDPRRQRNGVSPNYIHSLDAAAMQHTICIGLNEGITHFAMIHDSYGTHAADSEALAKSLRFSFVDLFGGDINLLEVIRKEVETLTGEADLPAVPPCGTLDVRAVQDSLYFFA